MTGDKAIPLERRSINGIQVRIKSLGTDTADLFDPIRITDLNIELPGSVKER